MAFALVIQTFAVISPPQPSLASSTSDLMNGGFSSKSQVVEFCKKDVRDYEKIVNYFGITCADIQAATETRVKPHDHNDRLYSMGRLAYGVAGEQPVNIPGAGTFYLRHFWSLNKADSYKALKGTTKYGETFYVLFDCGNLVFIGVPQPPKKCKFNPNLPADSPKCFEPCPVAGKSDIPKGSAQCFVPCPVAGKQDIPKDSDKCFVPCPIPGKAGIPKSSAQCFEPCPYNKKIPSNDAKCFVPCPVAGKSNIPRDDSACFEPCPVNGKSSIAKNDPNCFEPCQYNQAIPSSSPDCFEPCKYNGTINSKDPGCKPCEESQTSVDLTACLVFNKSATNDTQKIADANGTTAKSNDVITYTLMTKNSGKETIKNYTVNENISDVLDYATVVDLHGGKQGEDALVTWPAKDIKGGETLTQKITVKIKDPIPSTPVSTSDSGHFNMVMTNVYGNVVEVKLPPSITKTTELATTQLPNTGPGTSLAIAFTVTVLASFFFSRSRLLARELDIVRTDFSSAGGY